MTQQQQPTNDISELAKLLAERLADPLQSSVFTEARLLQRQRGEYDDWPNDLLDEVSCFDSIAEMCVSNEDDDERADAWSELHPAAMAGYLIEYLITYLQHQAT